MQISFGCAAAFIALAFVSACTKEGETGAASTARVLAEDSAAAPKDAAAGTCHATDRTPARLETVTEQVLVSAAVTDAEGKVLKPASYRTETRQKMTGGGEALTFQTPCKAEMTTELLQSLQRSLQVRGLYKGKIDGVMSASLRQSIRRYQQQAHGLDSAILSMQAARSLGLIAYERDAL